jgi:hypothetical protein
MSWVNHGSSRSSSSSSGGSNTAAVDESLALEKDDPELQQELHEQHA